MNDGGARAILQRMARHPTVGQVQLCGLKALHAQAVHDGGFLRISLAREVIGVSLSSMETFTENGPLVKYGCLLLGWAAKDKVGQSLQPDLVGRAMASVEAATRTHHLDDSIAGAASWAMHSLTQCSAFESIQGIEQ
ncbi:unnamed protein product [Chrysoparadoxa australica]